MGGDDFDWKNATNEQAKEYLKIENNIKKNSIVVEMYSDLSAYDDHLAYEIGHSRKGQHYYILCNKDTLQLSILATNPDGCGSDIALPDILIEMIKNEDIV